MHIMLQGAPGAIHAHPADIDHDGRVDFVFSSRQDDTVRYAHSKGTAPATFEITTLDAAANNVRAAAALDVNGDCDMDIVSAARGSDAVIVYPNHCVVDDVIGSTGGQVISTLPTSGSTTSLAPGPDCALECQGSFDSEVTIDDADVGFSAVDAGDINGDGKEDLLVAHTNGDGVYWYENIGGGKYTRHAVATDAAVVRAVELADIDGDGDLDAVSAWFGDNVVALHLNDGTGAFTTVKVDSTADQPNHVTVADIDGDGKMDIFATHRGSNSVVAYVQESPSVFRPRAVATSVKRPWAVIAGDIDGDGDMDCVVSSQDGAIMFRQNNKGVMKSFPITTCSDARGIALGDIDGDGKLDIVTSCLSSGTVTWHAETKGLFSSKTVDVDVEEPIFASVADVDQDGHQDILVAARRSGGIQLYSNSALGIFSSRVLGDTHNDIRAAVVTDMDLDGDLDIVGAAKASDALFLLENTCCQVDVVPR